jgi:N utilization substance protein B
LIMAENKKKTEKKPAKSAKGGTKPTAAGAARLAAAGAVSMDIGGAGSTTLRSSRATGSQRGRRRYLSARRSRFFRDVVAGVVRDQAKLIP